MARLFAFVCFPFLLSPSPSLAQAPAPVARANDNRTPAGHLSGNVLTLQLDVVRASFHPDADDDPGVVLMAFAEKGKQPSIPGPLIRVPRGTEVHTTITNTLADSSILVFGLSGNRDRSDTVRIKPGETRELITSAPHAGTFAYMAMSRMHTDWYGEDRLLGGAFVVDEPNAKQRDRVFVLQKWTDSTVLKEMPGLSAEVLTINGKAWPNTERLTYDMGETITWRFVNASMDTHPMHLHGTYFDVVSKGFLGSDTTYTATQVRKGVTERMTPLQTMVIQWTGPRPGNWLFHCHLNFHVMGHPPLGPMKASDEHDAHQMDDGMGGLVLGTLIRGADEKDARPRRQLSLYVQQYDSIPGEYVPPFSFELKDAKLRSIPAPPIIVQQNEPIAIVVRNRSQSPTSIHWHGLEIQSYYDGVPGFGGTARRTAPMVAPGDSFTVLMTPPRAGTFIYHSHAEEARQQGGGAFGAFVVVPAGKKWDENRERILIISSTRTDGVAINNGADTLQLTAGTEYRLRLINITLDRPAVSLWLSNGDAVESWRPIAKDGADLPAAQALTAKASMPISIGETYDVLYTPHNRGSYKLEVRKPDGTVLATETVNVN